MGVVPPGGAASEVPNMSLVEAAVWLIALGDLSTDATTSTQLHSIADALWQPMFRDDEFAVVAREAARQARIHFRDVSR